MTMKQILGSKVKLPEQKFVETTRSHCLTCGDITKHNILHKTTLYNPRLPTVHAHSKAIIPIVVECNECGRRHATAW